MEKVADDRVYENDPVRVLIRNRVIELGLKLADVSRKLGKNHAYMQQYLRRGVPLTLPEQVRASLAKILKLDEVALGAPADRVPANVSDTLHFTVVPEYNVLVETGEAVALEEYKHTRTWPLPRDYLEELGVSGGPLALIHVRGDSMEPTLRPGDRILVDQGDQNVSQPGIFVLWDGDGRVVKRIERVYGSEPPKLRLISDNPRHSTYEVPAEIVRVVGRAVWAARQL
jgi:phage repressor protein C with HTH and peptisase S24 domain